MEGPLIHGNHLLAFALWPGLEKAMCKAWWSSQRRGTAFTDVLTRRHGGTRRVWALSTASALSPRP